MRSQNTYQSLAVGALVLGLATFLRWLTEPLIAMNAPFLFFFPALVVAVWAAGTPAALVVGIGTSLVAWYRFTAQLDTLALTPEMAMTLIGYVAMTAVIILVLGRHRTTTLKLQEVLEKQDARAERLELMFQETEHRVANGLTMVSSLLAMHARSASIDPASAPELFRQAQDRVAMIGQVHRALAAAEPGASQLDLHARSVAQSLQELAADRVQIVVDMPPVRIGHEAMQAILMLMGEAVQNSLKHGFPAKTTGAIRVELRVGAERTVLTVADNGVGMASGAPDRPDGLGFHIMRGLARGLGGSLEVSAGKGLCVTADFPTARLGLEPVSDGPGGGERRRTAGPPSPGAAVGYAAGMNGAARGA